MIFEEPSLGFGTRRFLVYNPRDRQRVTVQSRIDSCSMRPHSMQTTPAHRGSAPSAAALEGLPVSELSGRHPNSVGQGPAQETA